MKIAVLTQYFPTSAQPWAGHSAYQTLRVLAARHPLRVFYPESRYPKLLAPRSFTHTAIDPQWQPAGLDPATTGAAATTIDTQYIPYPALPLLSRPLNGWTISRKLLPAIHTYQPDIILNYVVYPDGYAAVCIGQKLNIPVVLTAIGSDLNRIAGRLPARHTSTSLRHAAWTTTVSSDLLHTALRLGAHPGRATAILNGCDTAIFHPRDHQQARQQLQSEFGVDLRLDSTAEIVLYVGRLDLRKGLAELVEAVTSLRQRRPNLRCVLVGDGPAKPHLVNLVNAYAAQETIRFISPCPTARVALWMAAADLVALPSYMEGCPNVIIEALACGRPVVATNVGGIPELLGSSSDDPPSGDSSSGRLIPPRDTPALAAALDEVLTTPWDPADLARRHARGWTDVANDLESVLQRTLTQSRKF